MQLLRVPDVEHSTVSTDQTQCAKNAMIAFITTAQAPASCAASKEPQAQPLPPASLSMVRPARSASRLAGQGSQAAAITIEDVFGQPSLSGGDSEAAPGRCGRLNGAQVHARLSE